jgi:hypothetical protein
MVHGNHFSKIKEEFFVKGKTISVDCYFTSYQTPEKYFVNHLQQNKRRLSDIIIHLRSRDTQMHFCPFFIFYFLFLLLFFSLICPHKGKGRGRFELVTSVS